jgi:hypothetical protein
MPIHDNVPGQVLSDMLHTSPNLSYCLGALQFIHSLGFVHSSILCAFDVKLAEFSDARTANPEGSSD